MKYFLTLLLVSTSLLTANAQDQKIIEYPFNEPGSEPSRGVFGKDDRKEIKDAEGFKQFARATAAMVTKSNAYDDDFYSWSLRDRLSFQFNTDNFDNNVKFLDQPTVASCTGFLIAPDILVTAGHCINSMEEANNVVWIFDYTSESNFIDGKRLNFKNENIYEVEEILASKFDDETSEDYAVLKLKRASERTPYRFRTSGTVLENGPIYTIGTPTGLPLKFSTNAMVVDTSPEYWFKSDIDAFPGNSGGPVFDKNGFIEGILVRGAVTYNEGRYTGDYKYDSTCNCVKTVQWDDVKYTAGCQAHKINTLPTEVLLNAIYSNIAYAIVNNLIERFESWEIYSWIFNHTYTTARGRFENLALESNNIQALEKILKYSAENLSDDYARALIDIAISKNNLELLELLLNNDLLADAGITTGYTALQNALDDKNIAVAELLIAFGADVKTLTNKQVRVLLDAAIRNETTESLETYLNTGISPDASAPGMLSALQIAVKEEQIDIVETLISYGADVDTKTSDNDNLLHLAAKTGNMNLAKLLIKNNVSTKSKNKDKMRPEKIAKKAGYKSLAKYLRKVRKS